MKKEYTASVRRAQRQRKAPWRKKGDERKRWMRTKSQGDCVCGRTLGPGPEGRVVRWANSGGQSILGRGRPQPLRVQEWDAVKKWSEHNNDNYNNNNTHTHSTGAGAWRTIRRGTWKLEEVGSQVIRSSRGLWRGEPGGSYAWDQSEVEGKEQEKRGANATVEPHSATAGNSQPHSYPREMLLGVSISREGCWPLKTPALASTHSFLVCTLMHLKRIQTIFPFHNWICCSRPDRKGTKAAWPSPLQQLG